MNNNILELENIVKTYGDKTAVDNVTFDVPKGSIFGLLGPNGAGKTSLIRIITSITRADSGHITLDGEPIQRRLPEHIGYMPEERGLYKKMKVGEHLLYLAQLKGLSYAQAKQHIVDWMTRFKIEDWWSKRVNELSKGMQQKIQFIATVMHRPKLLILDEPFSGLDPVNTNLIKDEIHNFQQEGVSIIFSTHRMEQVEEICERIVLINHGQKVLEGQVADVKQKFKENKFRIEYQGELPGNWQGSLNGRVKNIAEKPGELVVQFATEKSSNQLLQHLIQQGVYVTSFNEILPTLNQVFIKQVQA
jgi:ABC-2 type transport system ATP-binding protein